VTAVGTARIRIVPAAAIRVTAMIVCGAGIVGMIIGSIADSNAVAVTFGLITAAAALCLIAISAVAPPKHSRAINEADAEALENAIQGLVAAGADEDTVRRLVRKALDVGQARNFD
jgi:hypothetical protein